MVTTHNLGFPRIGDKRELKVALEAYWKGELSCHELHTVAARLRRHNWQAQSELDFIPVGDFSFYDQVLDMSVMLGNLPARVQDFHGSALDNYFRVARGRSAPPAKEHVHCCGDVSAAEMTKWFDTNYHYIVPEFTQDTRFTPNTTSLLAMLAEAKTQGIRAKPVLIGPLTYLALGKSKDNVDKLTLLNRLLPAYVEILAVLARQGIEWVQIDEPLLVMELNHAWSAAFIQAYTALHTHQVNLLLTTYFGQLNENITLVSQLPVQGIHLDTLNAKAEIDALIALMPANCVISLGVINGRNIWKTDLNWVLSWLQPLHNQLKDRLWIAPSCSLLHVPVNLDSEQKLDSDIRSWLAFARQKLTELVLLARALNDGASSVLPELEANRASMASRRRSPRVHNPAVKAAVAQMNNAMEKRQHPYPLRAQKQARWLTLPRFPTTTIGSFPQTADIRTARREFNAGRLEKAAYRAMMRAEIAHCVKEQEKIGLDVLVHGEAERNDMVEYFGEQLAGYAFSQFGWVQSYGSRCVKPPIVFGDIHRPKAMTVEWTQYAMSLTTKPMKGMLTGPVTMLNWSFVRDDQPRHETCKQLALAIREEVLDLEKAGVRIIQIDEAALREGLPLRKAQWPDYLAWAVSAYRVAANGVQDETQIHTHMCYAEFNDIIAAIADMDADVITIETSRSDMALLDVFDHYHYPNEIGPGVYDIHSPVIPGEKEMVKLMQKAAQRIPAERLWVNPDCGLKTRQWAEVRPALINMVAAAKTLRAMAR